MSEPNSKPKRWQPRLLTVHVIIGPNDPGDPTSSTPTTVPESLRLLRQQEREEIARQQAELDREDAEAAANGTGPNPPRRRKVQIQHVHEILRGPSDPIVDPRPTVPESLRLIRQLEREELARQKAEWERQQNESSPTVTPPEPSAT